MSVPLKIWVPMPVTDEGPCYVDKDEAEMQWGCTAVAYHHDDVVRELVEALEECADDLAEWIAISDSLKRAGFNMDDTGQRLDRARAALAKIAQDA